LDETPSFNVKFYDQQWKKTKILLGTFHGIEFKSDKIRLNNMAYSNSWKQLTEVDAYDTFRRIGYSYMPVATDITLSTYRGSSHQRRYGAALIEIIDNTNYFKRPDVQYGSNYMVLEVDGSGMELKKTNGIFNTSVDTSLLTNVMNRDVEQGESSIIDYMNHTETLSYYAAERLTRSWDGACLTTIPNNFYVILWQDDTGNMHVHYMPKGMDRVFHGCSYDFTVTSRQYCGPVQAFLESNKTPSYDKLFAMYESLNPHKSHTCAQEVGITLGLALSSISLSVLVLAIVQYCWINGRCRV